MDVDAVAFVVGECYVFRHRRKGRFVGMFLEKVPTEPGDADPYLLRLDIKTHLGSRNEHLATSWTRNMGGVKVPPDTTQKLIRPSLLLEIGTV